MKAIDQTKRGILDWGVVDGSVFSVSDKFPKIDRKLFEALLDLFYVLYTLPDTPLEVSVKLVHRKSGADRWEIKVPLQEVSSYTIRSTSSMTVDLVTGEESNCFPEPGWRHGGSAHSHHNMPPVFSALDDSLELLTPGIHIVVGLLDQDPTCSASIVLDGKRYYVNLDKVVDLPDEYQFDIDQLRFHPTVLEYVTRIE